MGTGTRKEDMQAALLDEIRTQREVNRNLDAQLSELRSQYEQQRNQLQILRGHYEHLMAHSPDPAEPKGSPLIRFIKKWFNPKKYARFLLRRALPGMQRRLTGWIRHWRTNPPKATPLVESTSKKNPISSGTSAISSLPKTTYQVSVVIPTYNGAEDLPYLLRALQQQQLCSVEVIAIDSGSSDDTLSILEYFGAQVIQIDNSEFSHSHARNLGVERASHPLTLCTVQDALPTDDLWLHRFCSLLKDTGCDAMSLAQTPRTDADLFAAISIAEFNDYLGISHGRTNITSELSKDPVERRRQAQLDNVAALYVTSSLRKRQFEGAYGEDINIGLRLVGDGRTIGKTGAVQVIHSHARKPGYYLKRYFVDTKHLLLNKTLEAHLVEKSFVGFKKGFAYSLAFLVSIQTNCLQGIGLKSAVSVTQYFQSINMLDPVFVDPTKVVELLKLNLPTCRVFDEFCDPLIFFEQARKSGGEVFQHSLYAFQRQLAAYCLNNAVFDSTDQNMLFLTLQQAVFGTAGSLIAYYEHESLIPSEDEMFVDSLREKV